MTDKQKLIFIAGPTGVGKTDLSLQLAEDFNGEIISMDSMQIYNGMDIGTAKVSIDEQKRVVHHLIDIVEPGERFTVQDYQELAKAKIEEIGSKNKTIFFVGGTGLYMDAIIQDYSFADVDRNDQLRQDLEASYDQDGGQALYKRLQEADPATAKQLTTSDKKKIIRALEILEETNKPLSQHKLEDTEEAKYDSLIFILNRPRPELYARIDQRVNQMVEVGLIEENMALLKRKLHPSSQALQAIGYREILYYLKGLMTKEESIRLLQQNTRNYAKRQLTWFRKTEGAVWIDVTGNKEDIYAEMQVKISAFLKG